MKLFTIEFKDKTLTKLLCRAIKKHATAAPMFALNTDILIRADEEYYTFEAISTIERITRAEQLNKRDVQILLSAAIIESDVQELNNAKSEELEMYAYNALEFAKCSVSIAGDQFCDENLSKESIAAFEIIAAKYNFDMQSDDESRLYFSCPAEQLITVAREIRSNEAIDFEYDIMIDAAIKDVYFIVLC